MEPSLPRRWGTPGPPGDGQLDPKKKVHPVDHQETGLPLAPTPPARRAPPQAHSPGPALL